MALESYIILTKNTFDAYVADNDGIIIFHKKLCPHCKIMGTVLDKVQAKLPTLKLAAVDSENELDLKEQCGAERVPTLVVHKGGKLGARFVGIMNPAETLAFYQKS